MESTRKYWVDYLRIVSSILIILIHVSANNWYHVELSLSWIISNIGVAIGHVAVPIFFMISGMFFLDQKKDFSIKRLLKKNVLRLFMVYVFSMLFYGGWMLLQIIWFKTMPLDSFGTILSILLQGHNYLWFLTSLCGIYLITPLLRIITSHKEAKKYISYYLILFIIFNLALTTVKAVNISDLLNSVINNYLVFKPFQNYLAYFFLGFYLNTYELSPKLSRWLKGLLVPSLILMIGIPTYQAWLGDFPQTDLFDSYSIFTFIFATNLFLAFKHMKPRDISKRKEKILVTCSKCTLGVYIFHAFILEIFTHLGWEIQNGPLYLTIPLFTIAVFLITLLLSYILRCIGNFFSNLFHKIKAKKYHEV